VVVTIVVVVVVLDDAAALDDAGARCGEESLEQAASTNAPATSARHRIDRWWHG
jgi:hypothetical protein